MKASSLNDSDQHVLKNSSADDEPRQVVEVCDSSAKNDNEPANKTKIRLTAFSDLLDAFLTSGIAPEPYVDQALLILRLSPNVLFDADDSSVVAFLLTAIEKADERISSKYLTLLSGILSLTFSSKSLRLIIDYLVPSNGIWRPYSYEIIHQLKIASSFPSSMSFLVFTGDYESKLMIPPISKFPYQNGWTFHSWIYINPPMCKPSEVNPRYLFCFQTDKGLGYAAYFLGTLLIITAIRTKDKGVQHCVPSEFHPCKWYMLTVAFVYNRWTKSELRCYVDGKLISSVEMAWPITTSNPFDKCIIGGSSDHGDKNVFSGRIASITGFTEALSPQQISALYSLGPNYKGQLRFESEVRGLLSEAERKALIETKLSGSIMFTYHPLACDHNLCLDQSPKPNSVFTHSPHALMQGKILPVRTSSLQSALQSLGGIQLLYLLFEQLDFKIENLVDSKEVQVEEKPFPVAALLFNLTFDLARTSYALRSHLASTNGLVVFAQALLQSAPSHLTDSLLNGLLEASRYLTRELLALASRTTAAAPVLLTLFRQLFDKLLFAPGLWLKAPVKVQDRLYGFLADEFRVDLLGQSGKSIVASALHAIKYYFWIVPPAEAPPTPSLKSTSAERPPLNYLARIRSNILLFIKPLILEQYHASPFMANFPSNGEEVDILFNFLSTVKEPDNLKDVLYFTLVLMSQYPAVMVPWFDRHDGIQCVFQLLSLPDEDSRLYAVKLFGFFLKYSKAKRKQEAVDQPSILSSLGDRFAVAAPAFTMKAYNVFFELLTEDVTLELLDKMPPMPTPTHRIENPALLKTIALLIIHSKRTAELMIVRQIFLEHLLALCLNSEANRRSVLQMSVWQDWVIGLASLFPQNRQNSYATATVLEVLRCLLFYALRFEFGGWRVWIDTLAILHSRIAFEELRRHNLQQLVKSQQEVQLQPTADQDLRVQSPQQRPGALASSKEGQESSLDSSVEEIDLTDTAVRDMIDDALKEVDTPATDRQIEKETNNHKSSIKEDEGESTKSATNVQQPDLHAQQKLEGAFKTPPFAWSYLHQILLDSVLRSVEDEFHAISILGSRETSHKEKPKTGGTKSEEVEDEEQEEKESMAMDNLQAFINEPANLVYAINLIHFTSQLSDNLITACGGLLPLLAAATSPTMDLELHEPSSGLSLETAFGFLLRVANIVDIVVFIPSINLGALEKETGMTSGGIVRQCLRLACLCTIRNCLEARLQDLLPSDKMLAQLNTYPAPHHHVTLPLPPLIMPSQEAHPPSSSSSPLSSSAGDLADASSIAVAETSTVQTGRQSLSGFYFYGSLCHKLNTIQRLANPSRVANSDSNITSKCIAYLERLRCLPINLQRLILGLRPFMANYCPGFMGGIFEQTVVNPRKNIAALLQTVDINRLHNVIYRNEEKTRQMRFVALAVIYFLSVLMVSKYRDLLDPVDLLDLCQQKITSPPPSPSGLRPSVTADEATVEETKEYSPQSNDSITEARPSSSQSEDLEATAMESAEKKDEEKNESAPNNEDLIDDGKEVDSSSSSSSISGKQEQTVAVVHQSIPATDRRTVCSVIDGGFTSQRAALEISKAATPSHLPPPPTATTTNTAPTDLTDLLELALGSSVPLLKEIFFDFEGFLAKTLVGSHGQDLLFTGGLSAFRSCSLAVEVVMLLCSQEGQNSLQKHAGLAFIELVNECRLLAKASREHFISVAHEADFILTRLRSFELRHETAFRAKTLRRQKSRTLELDSRQTRRLEASGVRDGLVAVHCLALTQYLFQCLQQAPISLTPMISKTICGEGSTSSASFLRQTQLFHERMKRPPMHIFYRLDTWEDDSRRRRRLVINPFGSNHPEAVLHASTSPPPPSLLPTPEIDSAVLNLRRQSEQQITTREDSDTQNISLNNSLRQPSTPSTPGAPLALTDSGLTPGLVSLHQNVFTFGQLEPDVNNPVVVYKLCKLIAAGVAVHGSLSITSTYLAFETDPSHEKNQKIDPQVLAYTGNLYSKWSFNEIRAVFTRRHLLHSVALEIFLTTRSSVMFALPDEESVREVICALPPVGIGVRYGVPQSHRASLASGRQLLSLSHATQRWQRREMSNFDYLMCLNTLAGRSFNDLNQYPIFPWVLTNYTDAYLDLNEPANYRDLSKPVGALDPARKAFFDERYADWEDPTQPPFHYGTHYSTAAFVLNYLIRLEPFTTLFLNMQGGKFDHPNRMFHSVEAAWTGCLESSTNVKELIPEFFYLPEMFENSNDYDLGTLEDGTKLGHVVLPPWAACPEEFVRIHQQALESELVSCQLHHWIDLIFGYKQCGPEAVKATNVFHYLTYEGSVNWSKVTDPVLREALEGQITCFGQTPSQLMLMPHPPRGSALAACPRLFTPPLHEVAARLRPASRAPLLGFFFASAHQQSLSGDFALLAVTSNCVFTVNKWSKTTAAATESASKAVSAAPMSTELKEATNWSPESHLPTNSNFPTSATLPVSQSEGQSTSLLTLDPVPLAPNAWENRLYVGDNMDPSIRLTSSNFVVIGDGRGIVACGYFDYSFRIFSVDSGRCVQSVCGHQGVVTCLDHSDSSATGHCYLASGSRDGLVCLWILNTKTLTLFTEFPEAIPLPYVTLFGHENELQCIAVSAELGLVFSGSEGGVCLLHTTQGELLRRFEAPQTAADRLHPRCGFGGAAITAALPTRLAVTRHGYVVFRLGAVKLAVFTLNGRLVAAIDFHRQMQVDKSNATFVSDSAPSSSSSSSNDSPLMTSHSQTAISTVDEDGYTINALVVTRCAHFLLVADSDGLVSILHLYSLRLLHCLPPCKAPITALDLSPDQRFIVAGLSNGGLVVFNVNFNRWKEEIQEGQLKKQSHVKQAEQTSQLSSSSTVATAATTTTRKNEEQNTTEDNELSLTPAHAAEIITTSS